MPELATDFQALPSEYQAVIHLAQDTHKITVAPLQLLVGGWSGAVVYLVSVSSRATNLVEHCILKLDRKGKSAKSDEVTRHNSVLSKSTPAFARDHIAELVFDRVEQDGAIAIFYRIAGQSLLKYRPLSNYERQSQLKTIFIQTNRVLLQEWNADVCLQTGSSSAEGAGNLAGLSAGCRGEYRTFLAGDLPGPSGHPRLSHQWTCLPQSIALRAQAGSVGKGTCPGCRHRISSMAT